MHHVDRTRKPLSSGSKKPDIFRLPLRAGLQKHEVNCISRPLLLFLEGVEVRVARIFNTFGPRMHMNDGRVVSNFILQALQGEPLTVCAGLGWGQKKLAVCQQVTKEQCFLVQGITFPQLSLCAGHILLPLVTRGEGVGLEPRRGAAEPGGLVLQAHR